MTRAARRHATPAAQRRVEAIVIGASAGGVEALLTLLPALPAGLAAAVFVVIHLPRSAPSLLADIFAPHCKLAVEEAFDKLDIAPCHVYLAPPDYHLLIERGPRIALSTDEPVHWSRPSIDVLFESAADVYGDGLLGIILTGWNRDGATGLAAVRRNGGATVVQQPDSAQAAVMPASALAEVQADWVLPIAGIAELLRSLGSQARLAAPAPALATTT